MFRKTGISLQTADARSGEDDIQCVPFSCVNMTIGLTTREVIFMGINDCGAADSADDLEAIIETIFDALHDLYVKAQARHFVLVDVPPIDRSPQGTFSPYHIPTML